ncbi:hypothetical protein [Bacillus altitudinis]|uniref:hypothetical protein n=1 Tax=Bacillus altitudinis TaxID=293387 RepID=UPI002408F3CB|nr:hypothetical protein [Bacillus altitudinis]WEZ72393.1 hypothetical protein P5623_06280 [Bacillus altitudinis]
MDKLDKYFGIRLCYTILIWIVFGGTLVNSALTQLTIISTIILFLLPIAFDNYSLTPIKSKNIKRRLICIWSILIVSSILAGILFAKFEITFIEMFWVKILIWFASGFYVYITTMDWVEYSTKAEMDNRKAITNLIRKNRETEMMTMTDRVDYYKQAGASIEKKQKTEKNKKRVTPMSGGMHNDLCWYSIYFTSYILCNSSWNSKEARFKQYSFKRYFKDFVSFVPIVYAYSYFFKAITC